MREQRTKEAEARRLKEKEERLKRLQDKEEEDKMYREMLKRKLVSRIIDICAADFNLHLRLNSKQFLLFRMLIAIQNGFLCS